MENKTRYYQTFLENRGQLNEIELGEEIGLDEDETRKIIVQLLSEHKIEYIENKHCHYIPKKGKRRSL
ncbi:hypothetical protein [Sphingobacterium faecium]|uniref:hypothetical protein n=1 Tax=Sphingobacterium faecium TaxID=34087 RepID=UPI0004E5F9D3|nr:hypothetical protein [Sphingobacterium faecium]WGQ15079.1 hypothetical protein QG727_01425 [Sphingobacterium faecium]CDS91397.1 conserved hypothetical protein [Sphingobacterium sp. PM2-P1-29]